MSWKLTKSMFSWSPYLPWFLATPSSKEDHPSIVHMRR